MKWFSFFRRKQRIAELEKLVVQIEDFQSRNECVPEEWTVRLKVLVEEMERIPDEWIERLKAIPARGLEKTFHDYEALVSNTEKPVDLSRTLPQFRAAIEPGSPHWLGV